MASETEMCNVWRSDIVSRVVKLLVHMLASTDTDKTKYPPGLLITIASKGFEKEQRARPVVTLPTSPTRDGDAPTLDGRDAPNPADGRAAPNLVDGDAAPTLDGRDAPNLADDRCCDASNLADGVGDAPNLADGDAPNLADGRDAPNLADGDALTVTTLAGPGLSLCWSNPTWEL